MTKFLLIILNIFLATLCYSQSSNFRAQGYYYKAKELFESDEFEDAIYYAEKSKTTLGGTNYRLQYLHIRILFAADDPIRAEEELTTYFDLVDEKMEPKGFEKNVERLTADETKALTKMMVDIEEEAQLARSRLAYQKVPSILQPKTCYGYSNTNSTPFRFRSSQ
ncbi:hypothetical protein [Ekhidna sp.]